MNFAKSAISQVPTSTLMEIFVMSPPLLPSFFGLNCAHGVSLRTKRKSASTRLAGVDSLHVSSSLTTQSSSLSMSRQFSSLIISDGRLSMDGKSSDVYLPKVALKQSWSSSVLDWKHSGPSSAMNTESGRNRVGWRKQLDGRLHSHAIWLPFSWQMNSRRLLVMLTKTVFWSFSSAVRHGSRDFVKSSTHSSARLRLLQYLLKTVSKLPLGLACSISSVRLLMLTNFCTHSIRVVVACCRWRFYNTKKDFSIFFWTHIRLLISRIASWLLDALLSEQLFGLIDVWQIIQLGWQNDSLRKGIFDVVYRDIRRVDCGICWNKTNITNRLNYYLILLSLKIPFD